METLLTVAQVAAAITTIFGALGLFIKWALVKPIKAYIDHATYAISPGANGGRSMNDLVDKVDDLRELLNTHIKEHDTPK